LLVQAELNAGHTGPEVKFLSPGPGYTLFLTPAKMVLGFVASPLQKKSAVLRSPASSSSPARTGDGSAQGR